jgi:hypothetical protein
MHKTIALLYSHAAARAVCTQLEARGIEASIMPCAGGKPFCVDVWPKDADRARAAYVDFQRQGSEQ